MYSNLLVWTCLALASLPASLASFYVINPTTSTVCHGGQSCTVQWLDDGEQPLLSSIGASTVALYTGILQILQQIEPVDVSAVHSLTFTPDPKAGPNSNAYYLGFTSTVLTNGTVRYRGFSPSFSLDQMSGSFDRPVPSLTSTIPIPASVSAPSQAHDSTITLPGTLTLPTPPALPSFVPSISSTPSSSSSGSSLAPSSSSPSDTSTTTTSSSSQTMNSASLSSPSRVAIYFALAAICLALLII